MHNIKKIKNMDDISNICIYDIDNLTYYEEVDKGYKLATDIGFYVIVDNSIVGVMESIKGPIFFINDRLYYLIGINYRFSHRRLSEKRGNFQLIIDEEVKEDINYDIPLYTDYDPWSAEEDVDFFQWLNNKDIERFHNYYTSK